MPSMDERHGFPSVPLRRNRPAQQAQTRNTTMEHAPIQPQAKKPVYSMRTQAMPVDDLNGYPIEDEDAYYLPATAMPKSARRYVDQYGRDTRQSGNRRIVIDKAPSKRGFHWLFFIGLGMLAMLIVWQLGTMGVTAWNKHNLDSQYGNPRTYQVDENVGHGKGKSHFVFENLDGHVLFIEIPFNDMANSRLYSVTTLAGPTASDVPVTATFEDVNHDGRLDIVLHIGTDGASLIYLNTNTGFKPQTQQ